MNSTTLVSEYITPTPPIVWTIAGSDSGGGAGIQADLLTMQDLSCHGCSVITTLTAQNSVSVSLVEPVSEPMLLAQFASLLADLPPVAIKIGLLASQAQVDLLAECLTQMRMTRKIRPFVILDPVMVASSGASFNPMDLDFSPLIGLIDLLTPNQHELRRLCRHSVLAQHRTDEIDVEPPVESSNRSSIEINTVSTLQQQMINNAKWLSDSFNCHVLAKGGDALWQHQFAIDIYVSKAVKGASIAHDNASFTLTSPRITLSNNHGSGCTLSSAIACFIAHDLVVHDAIVLAKAYVSKGLALGFCPGQGAGVLARTGWPDDLEVMPLINLITSGNLAQAFTVKRAAHNGFTGLLQPLGIYPVVDDLNILKQLLVVGCKTIQYRTKLDPDADCQPRLPLENNIITAIKLGREFHAQLFINDHWQLALKHGAFGVHLGQEDMASADLSAIADGGLALGLSSHSYFEALLAHQYSPSYIALGHIFATTTKKMPSAPQGVNKLTRYVSLFSRHYPTVAIGGINLSNLALIAKTGVGDAAVVRAVTTAVDPAKAYLALHHKWLQLTRSLPQVNLSAEGV
ncbi:MULTISPECIES: bifunctional hydroxymethylpyrimidine kinase/phosphomethylpyrimidine kinase [Shewanella]|uniref:hydroxymethylpyrimidine kinase n=2 Tax=Gammaproteobacteria TaxID=1236 RepID=A0A3N4E496_9GAMM|nr:bifunctional hydroxymethylpyrimidine kinase/phosphomethylpyrimidine kinase [Shewanella psychromarinicola]AZG36048.1 thiamine-phosphate pyrophosphorylase [Shewanella psychromarinicola]MCL1080417.1 bifunctional hydroxymethylpyrimidine kinase/phosphomethylpyrimidine kinase [Shewanella psychromarinicola]RPA31737.1 thiamine-phosphate pyrophosphorylase [Shewanella psychromarinicola]